MTKSDLSECICRACGDMPKRQAAEIVETVLLLIKQSLCSGQNVKIAGFGSFILRQKGERVGRNPKNGELMTLSARRVVTFRPSPMVKERMNRQTG